MDWSINTLIIYLWRLPCALVEAHPEAIYSYSLLLFRVKIRVWWIVTFHHIVKMGQNIYVIRVIRHKTNLDSTSQRFCFTWTLLNHGHNCCLVCRMQELRVNFILVVVKNLNLLMPWSSPLCICAWRKWMKVGQTWRLLCIGENASISKLLRWNRQNHGTKQASDIFSLFFILFRSHFWKNQEFIRFSLQFSDVLYFLIGPGDCDVPFDEPRFGLCPFFGIFPYHSLSFSLLGLFYVHCITYHLSILHLDRSFSLWWKQESSSFSCRRVCNRKFSSKKCVEYERSLINSSSEDLLNKISSSKQLPSLLARPQEASTKSQFCLEDVLKRQHAAVIVFADELSMYWYIIRPHISLYCLYNYDYYVWAS